MNARVALAEPTAYAAAEGGLPAGTDPVALARYVMVVVGPGFTGKHLDGAPAGSRTSGSRVRQAACRGAASARQAEWATLRPAAGS
ncbi:hypothetical protein NMG29_32775 [Streptomyces cocklensis]|uniref:hypothetical protein n=1 Tax=Actinacidiphila cocklensis TaxID=887465 RepID=UPI00203C9F3E|nr:hypothetical protein [Actinacidiphila cocklensis]MDD1062919.1 hypothetical protein [Actinacidiphila cocklensis]